MKTNIKKNPIKPFLPLLLSIIFIFSQFTIVQADTPATDDKNIDYLRSIMNMIKEKYNGQYTEDQLIEAAVKGMLGSLDPYTTYFTPQEADSFVGSINGTYSGIGISLEMRDKSIFVLKVFSDSPAEKSGIIQGDKIVEVNGVSVAGKTPDQAAAIILGNAGTKVNIKITRDGRSGTLSFDIVRATIKINPVTYEIRGDIGYIKLDMFNSNTNEYLTKALEVMDKNKIVKIVLDLRDNPGGEVSQAVAVAQKFVPKGVITNLEYKSDAYADTEYCSYLENPKYKLAVLVNDNSASASEIVAGAIQDTGAGKLIGTKTFGKAKVQVMIPILSPQAMEKYEQQIGVKLADASVLIYKYGIVPAESDIIGYTKMTVGYYYTPNGSMIDGKGITPNIAVSDAQQISGIDVSSIQKLTKTFKPGLNSEGTDVYYAECILKVLGYNMDTPDTKLDAKTFNAIKQFQKNSKLCPYGVLDFTTQNALNSALTKKMLETDKQYAKAVEILK